VLPSSVDAASNGVFPTSTVSTTDGLPNNEPITATEPWAPSGSCCTT
jgi:hypothetical protein